MKSLSIIFLTLLIFPNVGKAAGSSISGDILDEIPEEGGGVQSVPAAEKAEDKKVEEVSGLPADNNKCAGILSNYVNGFNKFKVAKNYCKANDRSKLLCATNLMNYVNGFDKFSNALSYCKDTTPEKIACSIDLMGQVNGFDKFDSARSYCQKYTPEDIACAKGLMNKVSGFDRFKVSIKNCSEK